MSGGQYNISVVQILESERRLKLSSILKLFQKVNPDELSLREFINTFTLEEESVQSTPLEDFSAILDNSNPLPQASETALQALSFLAGYAVHSTHTKLKDKCEDCFSSLPNQNISN